MEKEEVEEIKQLLAYEEGSAGSLMTSDVFTVARTDTAAEVLNRLHFKKTDAETIYYLYVTDDKEHLLGVVALRQLIIAPPESSMSEIMNSKLISILPGTHRMEVLEIIKQYGLLALPVVTTNYVLLGIVTFDDVVAFL
jgi:Mg/Co/Ni transporter MgtE